MKKGSLNLSINAIIVIVIAFVFLGLAVTFVQSQIGGAGDTVGQVQDTIKAKILEDLQQSNKKLSFPTSELKLGKGDSKQLTVGVKNTGEASLNFRVKIYLIDNEGNEQEVTNGQAVETQDGSSVGTFNWNPGDQSLDSTDANAYPIKFTAGRSSGTYIFKVAIEDQDTAEGDNKNYASKDFFINVI